MSEYVATYHKQALVGVDDADEDIHVGALAVLVARGDQHVHVSIRALKTYTLISLRQLITLEKI